ncbi:hypothetical protein IJ750_01185 [bacterium]|nr:hypothetical protein [bacterium]
MPEVQNVGAVDYANPYQQYEVAEPSQVPAAIDGTMPELYDPEVEQKKQAAGSMTGLKVLGGIAAAGLLLWGGHKWGKNSAKDAMKELEELKNSEAVRNYDKMKEAVNDVIKTAEETQEFKWLKPKTWKNADFVKTVKEKLSPFKDDAEKVAEDAEKKVEEAAESAEK